VKTEADTVADLEALRRIYPEPREAALKKVLHRFDAHARRFVGRSPFLVLSTSDGLGRVDASPRGGEPGFVHVLDDETCLVPDWPGNNRLDSLENIVVSGGVGLLFLIPGLDETLRINGRATLSVSTLLRQRFARPDGRLPATVIVVAVEEVYLHCARALRRSELWNPARHLAKAEFPTMGQMLADQIKGYDGAASDRLAQENRHNLY